MQKYKTSLTNVKLKQTLKIAILYVCLQISATPVSRRNLLQTTFDPTLLWKNQSSEPIN